MLASWWLAVVGLPVFMQPLPEAPDVPAAVALASGQVSMRQPCLRLSCRDAEWTVDAPVPALAHGEAPGSIEAIRPQRLPRLATRRFIGLYSPASRRDWFSTTGNAVLPVDTRYGFEAVRSPQTQLAVEIGTAYRLQPYSNDGTAVAGPVARGQVRLSQQLGERASLSQQVRVERGRENAYLRQNIGLDLQLDPQWSLLGDFELRHDTAGNGGQGRTDREGSVRLRYAF